MAACLSATQRGARVRAPRCQRSPPIGPRVAAFPMHRAVLELAAVLLAAREDLLPAAGDEGQQGRGAGRRERGEMGERGRLT